MSMMVDITSSVISHCKRNDLDRQEAKYLLADIVSDLDWDYGDTEEESQAHINQSVDGAWDRIQ